MKTSGYVLGDFDFERLKSLPVWTGLVCFSSLRGVLITLIRLLALVDFSCVAGTTLAVCRQVEVTQMIPIQHVDYANSKKQFETLFNFVEQPPPSNYKIKIQNINI